MHNLKLFLLETQLFFRSFFLLEIICVLQSYASFDKLSSVSLSKGKVISTLHRANVEGKLSPIFVALCQETESMVKSMRADICKHVAFAVCWVFIVSISCVVETM